MGFFGEKFPLAKKFIYQQRILLIVTKTGASPIFVFLKNTA